MPHFRVSYVVSAPDEAGAREIVDALCLEQTVELPLALVPPGTWINEHVVAKCESLRRRVAQPSKPAAGDVRWDAVVRYNDDTSGGELPQLLNVIFGNTSIKENVMVDDVTLSPTLLGKFLGPRFGTSGLRDALGVPRGAMLMTALKPMGTSVEKLARMAYDFAKGGIDIIKDDHGLANQRYAPYEERVRACCAAVKRANAETGRACVYAPCLNAPAHLVVSRAKFAKAAGAGAVLMIPGITGLDSARSLAEDPDFALPIICHPAILGAMLGGGSSEECRGFSHKALLGVLPRLAGCDATIFPSFGGRFGFSERECLDILEGSRRRMGSMPAILPCPGGGMTMEKVAAMRESYGEDVCFLIGGSLIGHSEDLVANAKHFMKIAGREDLYGPLEHGKTDRSSHAVSAPPTAAARWAEPGSGGELDRLKKQMATMEANLSKVTDMYLASEKARAEAAKHAASHGGVGVAAREHAPAPGSTLAPGVKAPPTPVEGNYSKVFNRPENRPEDWSWERIPQEMYKQDGGSFKGCSRFELLGKRGESTVFHVRYFEVEPGGWTTLEHHRHEHAVIGLRGEGVIQLGPHVYPVRVGDCAYTAPGDTHQLRNEPDAKEPFGFVCVVAADRDRPVEVDPGEFLKSAAAKHALQHGMRDAIEAQAKHRAEHAKAAGAAGAVAEGSACEWKPGAKKKQAAAAVESGSACEWTPGKKRG
jgi:ribulose-bisphosphate carboxylase large chain